MAPAEAAVTFPTAMSSTNLLILRAESVFLIIVGNDEEEHPSGVIILQIMHGKDFY